VSLRALCAVALALFVPLGIAHARAPEATCQLDQLSAARKLYSGSLKCWAKGFGSDELEALECLTGPEGRFANSYARAAAKTQKRGASCGLKLRIGKARRSRSGTSTRSRRIGFGRGERTGDAKLRASSRRGRGLRLARVRDRDPQRREARRLKRRRLRQGAGEAGAHFERS
jgi:hypothetical protein